MERLTLPHYGGDGHYMKCSESFGCDGNCGECDDLDKIIDRLAHYEDMEEQGRPNVPCKPGDTVFRICGPKGHKYIAERIVSAVTLCGDGCWEITSTSFDCLGKTVFLTREEAENALCGGAENGDRPN